MSGGGSRKRIKMSHQTGSDSSGVKALCDANPAKDTVCRHESTLQTLNTDIDAIRQLITCKICTRLLTEPYSLACGHTYCYICISGWFNVHRMTCPDCRIKITQQPAPSYILKEMTHIFASRVELLPDGETTKELDEQIKEAADTVTKAKNNKNAATGGLFKGLFKNGRRGMPLMPIYDPSDGVDRCPNCNWELEGSATCGQCGTHLHGNDLDFSDDDDDSLDSEDLDHEMDVADAEAAFGITGHPDYFGDYDDFEDADDETHPDVNIELFGQAAGGAPRRNRGPVPQPRGPGRRSRPINLDSDDGSDTSEDDEHDPDMENFLVDDEHVDDNDGDDSSSADSDDTEVRRVAPPPTRRQRRVPVLISDDEEPATPQNNNIVAASSDSDSAGPVRATGSQRVKRRPQPVVISDEDSSSGEDSNNEQPDIANGGFSPLQGDESDDGRVFGLDALSHDDGDSFDGGYGSGGDFTSEAPTSVGHHDHDTFYGSDHFSPDEDENASDTVGYGAVNNRLPQRSLTRSADTRAETPLEASTRQPTRSGSHRLNTLGARSERHTNTAQRATSPLTLMRQYNDRIRAQSGQGARAFNTPGRHAPNIPTAQPVHPFQLSNTLASINQRNQQLRTEQRARAERSVSAASSRSSIGGVDVQGASQSSSGSSRTLAATTNRVPSQTQRIARQSMMDARRRKRAVSISSESSEEDSVPRVPTRGRRGM